MNNKLLNLFEGESSVLDFLNPDNGPYSPLVEIPSSLNPYRDQGVRIYAKLMNMLPLANVKSLPAYNMLLTEKENGGLKDINTVIENSSGNTVLSLAVIARLMGIPHTKAVVSNEVTKGKLNLLRLLGTEIIVNEEPICPDPSDVTSGIYKSKMWAKENNWFNPGQYDNEANPQAHQKWTAPQIWKQTKGKISILSVGLGTTGTVVGLGRFLKEKNPDLKIVGVTRTPNNPVPGVRTTNLLKEISFDWKSNLDHEEEVGTNESFKMSMELCRHGLMVGPSSGFALKGLLNHLSKLKFENTDEKVAVFICPDSPLPYIEEYFEYLDEGEFPIIENEHLLNMQHVPIAKQSESFSEIEEIEPKEIYKMLFNEGEETVWRKIKSKETISINKDYVVIDMRTESEFEDHHIPGSERVEFHDIDKILKKDKSLKKKKGVIFICKFGNVSRRSTWKAKQEGIRSINMKGGDVEWSRLNLPRIKSEVCISRYDLD